MQNSTKRQHYVGVAPQWLINAIDKNELPREALLSYEKLSTIASPEDVCFYDQYLRHAHLYIGEQFDDMQKICSMPENLRWLERYQDRAQVARVSFEATVKRLDGKLNDPSVPMTVRCYTYEPTAIGSSTLFFVPTEDATAAVKGSSDFFGNALDVLSKQLNVKDVQQFDVYQAFCTV